MATPQRNAFPAFDRASLRFGARKLDTGIHVDARFESPKITTGEPGSYGIQMRIDPRDGTVSSPAFSIARRGSAYKAAHGGGTDKLLVLAKKVRDEFVKSPAWVMLKDRAPDSGFIVDHAGKVTVRPRRPAQPPISDEDE